MWLMELANLGAGFKKYFQVVPAVTDELRDHVYRIRHSVYCEELGYEPVRPDRRESDEYDAHSLHCLVRSVRTGDFVGCTRLVLTRPGDPSYPLPVEKTCANTIDRSILDGVPKGLPALMQAMEISKRVVKVGFEWNELVDVIAKLEEELAELKTELAAPDPDRNRVQSELGDLLYAGLRA